VREIFTALALALVIGAALGTERLGLSPALGAFVGGVLLADSEYRHELESNLQPFKSLLLGLFFISVGMSISFTEFLAHPAQLAVIVVGVVATKFAILYLLATLFKMHRADRLLLAILLSQTGEFAFVVMQFANTTGALGNDLHALFTVAVALSMATTPLLLLGFDRLVAPRLDRRRVRQEVGEEITENRRIVVLGYGRFGQIVTRMLRSQGFEMTLIDDDAAQIELVRRFGVKVFYGDASRTELLHAAGVASADLVIIAVGGGERILEVARNVRRHFPGVAIAARAIDREHAHSLMELGVTLFERETFHSAIRLGERVLTHLGQDPGDAHVVARRFEEHDTRLLENSFAVRNDREAYIGMVRRSMSLLNAAMEADEPPVRPAVEGNRAVDKNELPRSG
jgi:glutathione-regulated potassium-efflux system ancillary protein KefC